MSPANAYLVSWNNSFLRSSQTGTPSSGKDTVNILEIDDKHGRISSSKFYAALKPDPASRNLFVLKPHEGNVGVCCLGDRHFLFGCHIIHKVKEVMTCSGKHLPEVSFTIFITNYLYRSCMLAHSTLTA